MTNRENCEQELNNLPKNIRLKFNKLVIEDVCKYCVYEKICKKEDIYELGGY